MTAALIYPLLYLSRLYSALQVSHNGYIDRRELSCSSGSVAGERLQAAKEDEEQGMVQFVFIKIDSTTSFRGPVCPVPWVVHLITACSCFSTTTTIRVPGHSLPTYSLTFGIRNKDEIKLVIKPI